MEIHTVNESERVVVCQNGNGIVVFMASILTTRPPEKLTFLCSSFLQKAKHYPNQLGTVVFSKG